MGRVQNALGVGNIMNRRDTAMYDAQLFVQHLNNRRNAIRSSGGSRHNRVNRRFKKVLVNAHNNV